MKNMLFKRTLYFLSILSIAMTFVIMATLPMLINWYKGIVVIEEPTSAILIIGYITAIPFIMILFSVMKLSKSLLKGNCFCKESLNELKVISLCSLIDFFIYFIVTIFVFQRLATLIVTIAALMVFIISSVIKELISNGIELKEENDLTI